jgi:putative sterol carrier protein
MTDGAPEATMPQLIFDELPVRFLPEAAGKTSATVQIELSGENGGRWWVRIANGRCTVGTGPVDKPDVTLITTVGAYLRIRSGELNPIAAAMPGGPMRIKGSYSMAIRFPKLFRRGD